MRPVLFKVFLFIGFLVINGGCANTSMVKDGEITKVYDDKGQLLEVFSDAYGFKMVYEDGGKIVKSYHDDKLEVTGYKLIATNKIYSVKNFTYDFALDLTIPDVFIVIGETVIGPMAAIIVPKGPQTVEYQKVKGQIEYIYIRSYPAWIADNILKNAVPVESAIPEKDNLMALAKKALDENFMGNLHINDYAMYNEEYNIAKIKILPQNIALLWQSTTKMISPINFAEGGYMGSQAYEAYWNEYSDGIFHVYYPNGSVIEKDPAGWLASRKEAFTKITNYLKVNWNYGPIKFYVFNDKKQGKDMGLMLGFANPYACAVYTTFDQTPGHELTHLIAYRIDNGLRIFSGVANEGLSTLMDQSGRNYHLLAKYLIENKIAFPKLLVESFQQNKYGYWLGASFVKFLIDTYGLDKYKSFFAQEKFDEKAAFKQFYNKSGVELETEWVAFLKKSDFGKLGDKEEKALKMMEQPDEETGNKSVMKDLEELSKSDSLYSEISNVFSKCMVCIQNKDMTGLHALMVDYPGMSVPSLEEMQKGEKAGDLYQGLTDLLFHESKDFHIKSIKKASIKGTVQYIVTAEFLFKEKWRPADFWFRVVDSKLGMDNFDIHW